MASVWKHPKSKYWSVCYDLADGRRVKESAKLTNRTKAVRVATALETEARAGLSERDARGLSARLHERYGLSETHAARMVSALYQRLGGRSLAASSVADFFAQWLARKTAEVAPGTARKYGEVSRHFLVFLGDGARRDLASIQSREIAAFRDHLASRLAVGTANIALKIVRIVFGDAAKAKLVSGNEAASVPILKASTERAARRPFTDAELRRLLAVAPPEWRAMILTGFYAGGQRLGDVARFTWQNVDLANGELRFVTRKTGRSQVIPIAPPLLTCLAALPSSDDPKAPVFPHARALLNASKNEHVGALSNEFHELLVEAGLAVPHVHHRTGEGRSARRKMGALGFHSLRHTFTSWAKSVGIGSAIVQDMVGHDSAAISAHYTTIDAATKRTALDSLPDLTAPAKARKTAPKSARKSARE
jgi:integrase